MPVSYGITGSSKDSHRTVAHAVARYRCTAMMILRRGPLGRQAGPYARDGVSLLGVPIPYADPLTPMVSRAGRV